MKTKHEILKELEIINDNLQRKPQSEFYKAYKNCLEWVLQK